MIKIRNGLFETNSSSGDVYDDCYNEVFEDVAPSSFISEVYLNITFELKEAITKSQIEKDEEQIIISFLEAYNEYVKDLKECFFTNMDFTEISVDEDDNTISFPIGDEFEFEISHEWDDDYAIFDLESDPPIWKEEWNEGLEHAISKSYCSKYIGKLHKVVLDDAEYNSDWKKLEDNKF